jgi:hypothetical protein
MVNMQSNKIEIYFVGKKIKSKVLNLKKITSVQALKKDDIQMRVVFPY